LSPRDPQAGLAFPRIDGRVHSDSMPLDVHRAARLAPPRALNTRALAPMPALQKNDRTGPPDARRSNPHTRAPSSLQSCDASSCARAPRALNKSLGASERVERKIALQILLQPTARRSFP